MLTEVDGIQSLYICDGSNAFNGRLFKDIQVSSTVNSPHDFDHEERVNFVEFSKYAVFYLTSLPMRDVTNKQQQVARGSRQTIIQGYNRPLAFYSPIYNDVLPPIQSDQRRTLYRNPCIQIDSNGIVTIDCHNSNYSAPLVINVETISNGVAPLTHITLNSQ